MLYLVNFSRVGIPEYSASSTVRNDRLNVEQRGILVTPNCEELRLPLTGCRFRIDVN